jgi:hypothetical protein
MEIKSKEKSKLKGRFRIITKDNETGIISRGKWQDNLISNANECGHNIIVRHLYGDTAIPLSITKGRFGTTDINPVDTDADIYDPLDYDIDISLRESLSLTSIRLTFFAPSIYIPDDTYYTFATYCGNYVFSMALLDIPFTKTGNVDTTIEYEYSIDNGIMGS